MADDEKRIWSIHTEVQKDDPVEDGLYFCCEGRCGMIGG